MIFTNAHYPTRPILRRETEEFGGRCDWRTCLLRSGDKSRMQAKVPRYIFSIRPWALPFSEGWIRLLRRKQFFNLLSLAAQVISREIKPKTRLRNYEAQWLSIPALARPINY